MPKRRGFCGAALRSTMCRGSGSRALRRMSAGKDRASAVSLLAAAARRCLRAAAEAGGVLLIIDAKNERAAKWYASYGAVPLNNRPLTLVMSLATFAAELKAVGQLSFTRFSVAVAACDRIS